jgi:8-oxo-dGTP pyrophosphatase MutT (NUDIX family)
MPDARARTAPLREPTAAALRAALGAHRPRRVEVPQRRRAGVLVPLFERDRTPWVVLTRRTEEVRSHKGEISFPGGAQDPGDADLWGTAVRETSEELGIPPGALARLGALDDAPTFASNFIISPFVAALEPPTRWRPNAGEIAEVIELPIERVLAAYRLEVWQREGVRYPMHLFDLDGHLVWGVTAFILRRFFDVAGAALGLEAEPQEPIDATG